MRKQALLGIVLTGLLLLLPLTLAAAEGGTPTAAEWQEMIRAAEEDLIGKLYAAYPDVPGEILSHFSILSSAADYRSEGFARTYTVRYGYDGVRQLSVAVHLGAGSGHVVEADPWTLDADIALYRAGVSAQEAIAAARQVYAAALDALRGEYSREYERFVSRYGEAAAWPEALRAACEWYVDGSGEGRFDVALYGPADGRGREEHAWLTVPIHGQTGAPMVYTEDDGPEEQAEVGGFVYWAESPFYVPQDAWLWDHGREAPLEWRRKDAP